MLKSPTKYFDSVVNGRTNSVPVNPKQIWIVGIVNGTKTLQRSVDPNVTVQASTAVANALAAEIKASTTLSTAAIAQVQSDRDAMEANVAGSAIGSGLDSTALGAA